MLFARVHIPRKIDRQTDCYYNKNIGKTDISNYILKGGIIVQVALNSKIEMELAKALDEYAKLIDKPKNAIISAGLMKAIPEDILIKNGVIKPQ